MCLVLVLVWVVFFWFCLCVCVWLVCFTQCHSLQDVSTAGHDLRYAPSQHSDHCPQTSAQAGSHQLEVSSQVDPTAGPRPFLSPNIQAPSWNLVFTRQCRQDLPLLFGFGWFCMFNNPSSLFVFFLTSSFILNRDGSCLLRFDLLTP